MPNRSLIQRQMLSNSVADIAAKLAGAIPKAIDGGLPPLTGVDRCLPKSRDAKTNPPKASDARMRSRHLAVARMIAEGKTNPQIATALGVTRQAVWKWSRMSEVIAEVRRTHVEMVRAGACR
jgi:DNA-binding NarL/FixJ family response regulator